jgi:hypothetical protein
VAVLTLILFAPHARTLYYSVTGQTDPRLDGLRERVEYLNAVHDLQTKQKQRQGLGAVQTGGASGNPGGEKTEATMTKKEAEKQKATGTGTGSKRRKA